MSNIQTYPTNTPAYGMLAKLVEDNADTKNAEVFAEIFRKARTANRQLLVLNTLNRILAVGRYMVARPRGITSDIQTTLLRNVQRYGENARPLSDRQIEVLADDFSSRAASGKFK